MRLIAPPPHPLGPDAPAPEARPPHPGLGTGGRIWLVRHGQVHRDWSGRAYGNGDVPLSPEGEEDTRRLTEALLTWDVAALASSPLLRARCLAETLAQQTGQDLRLREGLRELDRGAWQGLAVEEYAGRWAEEAEVYHADPWRWRGHGGESDEQLTDRAWPVLEELVRAADGGMAVLVAHFNIIRVLAAKALGIPAAFSFRLRNDPGHAMLLADAVALPGAGSLWLLERSNVRHPSNAPQPIEDVP